MKKDTLHSGQINNLSDEQRKNLSFYIQVKDAVNEGAFSMKYGDCQYTALHIAALFNDLELIKKLNGRVDFCAVDKDGYNALHLICSSSDVKLETVKCLLAANPGMINDRVKASGDIALHIACGVGAFNVAEYMLSKGAASSQLNKNGQSPFMEGVDFFMAEIEEGQLISDDDYSKVFNMFLNHRNFQPKQEDLDKVKEFSEMVQESTVIIRQVFAKIADKVKSSSKVVSGSNSELEEQSSPSDLVRRLAALRLEVPSIQITPPK